MSVGPLAERVGERARAWGVAVEESFETPSSLVAFGRRGRTSVVLKVVRLPGDEWRSGEVLDAIRGQGVVRVYEHAPGAVLLERLSPGTSLARMSLGGRDEEATEVLADLIRRMSCPAPPAGAFPTVEDWGGSFRRYVAGGGGSIPTALVERADRIYSELCASQRDRRLLHGDLHHYNVLLDSTRGWTAIDPKGVVGELEYEVGAALRNPCERPEVFASAEAVTRRLAVFETGLKLDAGRALSWAFAQAVLSAAWAEEGGPGADDAHPWLTLAEAILPMLA